MRNKIIVFLGPSLSVAQAQKILPDAVYLPPVKCADILRVMRLQPKVIAIIDGLFEHTAAVWHKEILLALEQGIQVFGASSMGALRAAELAAFGMQGIGEVFAMYSRGEINDDDEVALLHGSAATSYQQQSDALVNIRITMNQAAAKKIIDEVIAQKIIQYAKQLPYQQRDFAQILKTVVPGKIALLRATFIDQKRQDAITLLTHLRDSQLAPSALATLAVNRSIYLRALHNDVMCRPFHILHQELPIQEKVAMTARYFGEDYRLLRRLAYLWSAVYAIAKERQPSVVQVQSQGGFLPEQLGDQQWLIANDCTPDEFAAFQQRIILVNKFLSWQETLDLPGKLSSKDFMIRWMYLSDDYKTYDNNLGQFKVAQPLRYAILYYSAILWRAVEFEAERYHLEPNLAQIQDFANQFRYQRKLVTAAATNSWLEEMGIDMEIFTDLMLRLCRFRFLVMQGNLDAIEVFQDNRENIWWLLDMLRLTGMYANAKRAMADENFIKLLSQDLLKQNKIQDDLDAFNYDFMGGYQELITF